MDPAIRQGLKGPECGKEVHIEDDVWIGGSVIVLAWTKQHPFPNGDQAGVEHEKIEVEKSAFADFEVQTFGKG
jgi:hypothetical protein